MEQKEKTMFERFDEKFKCKNYDSYQWCCFGDYCESAEHVREAEDIKSFLATEMQRVLESIREEILDIPITPDKSDYELAQLRYREKVLQIINKHKQQI